jgi:hypothetical protein
MPEKNRKDQKRNWKDSTIHLIKSPLFPGIVNLEGYTKNELAALKF